MWLVTSPGCHLVVILHHRHLPLGEVPLAFMIIFSMRSLNRLRADRSVFL